jgi:hypothetical protein
MRLDVSEGLSALTRRLKDPVLLEWEQSIAWCDLDKQRGHEALRVLSRELVSRALPLGAAVLGLGLWFLSRIPDAGAAPLRAGLIVAGSLLAALSLPYAALRLGLLRPTLGTSLRVRLRARGVQVAGARGVVRMVGWATFDAFASRAEAARAGPVAPAASATSPSRAVRGAPHRGAACRRPGGPSRPWLAGGSVGGARSVRVRSRRACVVRSAR